MSTLFSGHYLRNRSTLDIGVLGYIGIVKIRNTLPKYFIFLLGHPVYDISSLRVNLQCLTDVGERMCPGDYAGGQSPGHQETEAATSLR